MRLLDVWTIERDPCTLGDGGAWPARQTLSTFMNHNYILVEPANSRGFVMNLEPSNCTLLVGATALIAFISIFKEGKVGMSQGGRIK